MTINDTIITIVTIIINSIINPDKRNHAHYKHYNIDTTLNA